jgi:hypothetical protein
MGKSSVMCRSGSTWRGISKLCQSITPALQHAVLVRHEPIFALERVLQLLNLTGHCDGAVVTLLTC